MEICPNPMILVKQMLSEFSSDAPYGSKKLPSYYSHNSPAKTTFGVKENVISSPMSAADGTQMPPSTPPIGQMNHRIKLVKNVFYLNN